MTNPKSPTTVKGAEEWKAFLHWVNGLSPWNLWHPQDLSKNVAYRRLNITVESYLDNLLAKAREQAKKNGEILAYGKLRQLFAEMPLRGYTSEELAECFDKIAPLDPKGLLKKIPKFDLTEKGEGVKDK